jgi:hypothetical protein
MNEDEFYTIIMGHYTTRKARVKSNRLFYVVNYWHIEKSYQYYMSQSIG